MSYSANNHKVPDMTAKRKFVLRFGSDKFANDMHVAQIKAIYGKHVKEGKLTLEDKSNVKVLIKATASECQRLMKTLTTLKGAPKEVQNTHLAGLGCCSKCAARSASLRPEILGSSSSDMAPMIVGHVWAQMVHLISGEK